MFSKMSETSDSTSISTLLVIFGQKLPEITPTVRLTEALLSEESVAV